MRARIIYNTTRYQLFRARAQYHPYGPIKPSFNFIMKTDEDKILPLKKQSMIQGKYDILQYFLKTIYSTTSSNSYIQFIIDEKSNVKCLIPEYQINIKLYGSYNRYILLILFLFIGFIFQNFDVIPNLSEIWEGIIGSAIVALSLYLIRKI